MRVRKLDAWTDGSGRTRSPFEEFRTLFDSEDAAAIEAELEARFEALEVGIVSDAAGSSSSKALQAGHDLESREVRALDVDEARETVRIFAPVWQRILDALAPYREPWVFLARDTIWSEEKGWTTLDARRWQVFGAAGPRLSPTQRSSLVAGTVEGRDLARFSERWWPSAAGFFAVLVPIDAANETLNSVVEAGVITVGGLKGTRAIAVSSSSFHNLGVELAADPAEVQRLLDELAAAGIVDGSPVSLLPPRT